MIKGSVGRIRQRRERAVADYKQNPVNGSFSQDLVRMYQDDTYRVGANRFTEPWSSLTDRIVKQYTPVSLTYDKDDVEKDHPACWHGIGANVKFLCGTKPKYFRDEQTE